MSKIKSLRRLNGRHRGEIRDLEAICNVFDGTQKNVYLTTDMNAVEDLKCFYLFYEEALLGFLELTAITEEDIELTAFVHPEYRRRGIFRKMLSEAFRECRKHQVNELVYYLNPKHQAAKEALISVKADYAHSEYQMVLPLSSSLKNEKPAKASEITVKEIKESQEEFYIQHMNSLFDMDEEESRERLCEAREDENIKTYLVYDGEKTVGFYSLFYGNTAITLFDFGVCKEYQGKGYAKAMLYIIFERIQEIKNSGLSNVLLHVSSENKIGTKLYLDFGFQVKEQLDYYKIPVT